MEFFTNLGHKLDAKLGRFLNRFLDVVEPPAPQVFTPPKPQVMYPEILVKLYGETMQAKLFRREFGPAIHDRVDITNDDAMTAALNKAGSAVWDPRFRLIDESEPYPVDLTPMTLNEALAYTKDLTDIVPENDPEDS